MKSVRIGLGVAYPFLVFAALTLFRARWVALAVGLGLVIRILADPSRFDRAHVARLVPGAILIGSVLLIAIIFNEGRLFLFVPALVNMVLLIMFGRTLGARPSLVETFARLQGYEISDVDKVRYCRTVTAVWCGFFLANIATILWLAMYASLATWTVYTGLVAYMLVGILLVTEVLYRAWRFRDYREGPVDLVLRRVFPPRDVVR